MTAHAPLASLTNGFLDFRNGNRLVQVEISATGETFDHKSCAALRFFRLQKPIGIEIKPCKKCRRVKAAKAATSAETTLATTAEPPFTAAAEASPIKSASTSKASLERTAATAKAAFAKTPPATEVSSLKPAAAAEISTAKATSAPKTAFAPAVAVKSAPSSAAVVLAAAKLSLGDCGNRQKNAQRANQTSKKQ